VREWLRYVESEKMIDANPCLDVERIAVEASDDFNILSPMEFESVTRECGSPREVAVLSVACYAGLRLGEVRELRWGGVDWAKRMLYVRATHRRAGARPPGAAAGRAQQARALDR
jgi:integrase